MQKIKYAFLGLIISIACSSFILLKKNSNDRFGHNQTKLGANIDLNQKEVEEIPRHALIDKRDDNSYPTLTIGKTKWMMDDLRFISHEAFYQLPDSAINGNFYSAYEASEVCPEGWSLPTTRNFKVYLEYFANQEERKIKVRTHKIFKSMGMRGTLPFFTLNNPLKMGKDGRVDNGKRTMPYLVDYWIKHPDSKFTHAHVNSIKSLIHTHEKEIVKDGKPLRLFKVKCVCELE